MNYLAHLSLAYPDPGLMTGNYICDLITPKETKNLHPSLVHGMFYHRWIDNFSNNHVALKEINKSLHELVHKYAPVASDIICDYLLYLSWEKHFDISYDTFTDYNYKILNEYADIMPERIAAICRNMIRHQWLEQYRTISGLEQVLKRTNQKAKFSVDLTLVIPVLTKNQHEFLELFNVFYIDCKKQGLEWISLQNEKKV